MFNPFERFQPDFIDAFKKAGKNFLVSQTFNRVADHFTENGKQAILMTQYADHAHCQIHLSALSGDPCAAILDLHNPKHLVKLSEMLHPESKYMIYSILIESRAKMEARLTARFREHIRRYITSNTDWRIGSDKTIKAQLDLAFGQLFIILKYANQQIRFTLEELEKT